LLSGSPGGLPVSWWLRSGPAPQGFPFGRPAAGLDRPRLVAAGLAFATSARRCSSSGLSSVWRRSWQRPGSRRVPLARQPISSTWRSPSTGEVAVADYWGERQCERRQRW